MRELYRRLIHVLFAVATFAFSPVRAADACTCVVPTCGDLAKADAVFEATIVSIEDSVWVVGTAEAASATFINGGGSRIVKLKDVRSWRGEAPAVLFTGQGGGDCGYDFQAGQRYLIEASRSSDGRFTTGICSMIRPFKYAAPLIGYLQALKDSPAQTRVIGTVARITGWDGFDNAFAPVNGAQLTLRGP